MARSIASLLNPEVKVSGSTTRSVSPAKGAFSRIAGATPAGASAATDDARWEALREALAAELGDGAFVFPADLSSPEGIEALIKTAEEKMGGVDILVNNAGLTRDNLSMRMKPEEWNEVIDVNLTAPFMLAKTIQRSMMKRRWGRIINVSSVVGVTGNAGQCNYVASKAGMIGWSKAMAQEIASRGITVNCIAPGFIATNMTEVLTDEQKAGINRNIPMGRMGAPDDIASGAFGCGEIGGDIVSGPPPRAGRMLFAR